MELVYLVLGWVLGLLSPHINERIKLNREKQSLIRGLNDELLKLRVSLALLSFTILSNYNEIKRERLQWIANILEDSSEYEKFFNFSDIIAKLKKLLQLQDNQITELFATFAKPDIAKSFHKHYLPFLESRIDRLIVLPNEYSQIILEIRSQVLILNDHIDAARYYHQRTFDAGLSEQNYKALISNYETSCNSIGERAIIIADMIKEVIENN